jgi:hypothetical protein
MQLNNIQGKPQVEYTKEFIIKMEGNTGELSDISGSEIHGGRCGQSIR